jgi:DNA invertase Pin-like site-specific DNA recombinase
MMTDEFEKALTEIKELRIRNSFDAIQSTWLGLIFRELRRLNENLETPLSTQNHGVDKRKAKESARARIEATFEKPLRELLAERKGKTVREIASEFGVSKTLVSRWRSRGDC